MRRAGNGLGERAFGRVRMFNWLASVGMKRLCGLTPFGATCWSVKVLTSGAVLTVGSFQSFERVETTKVPGATTSGLKRPFGPSCPTPTLPRLENAATSLALSVLPKNG